MRYFTYYEDYKTELLLEAKKYQHVRQPGFPYRKLITKLEQWDMTFGEFERLLNRIKQLKQSHD